MRLRFMPACAIVFNRRDRKIKVEIFEYVTV